MPLYALVTYIQLYGPRDAMNGKVSHFVTSGGAAGKLIVVMFLTLFQGTLASWSHQVSRQFVPLHNFAPHLLALYLLRILERVCSNAYTCGARNMLHQVLQRLCF